jgi:eukaryotic-like serine/threonine-protein kinase
MHEYDIALITNTFPLLDNITYIGHGTQKSVYSASHQDYGQTVLKLVRPVKITPRIAREIRIVEQYTFSKVPKIYESKRVLINNDEYLYIIEQYISGETLRQKLNSTPILPLKTVLKLLDTLLSTAHEMEIQKVVHRDIKPENIMLDDNEDFWLLDFGIARDLLDTSLTDTNAVRGPHSAGYAGLELFNNYKRDIDIRSDLFSIGTIAYEVLNGSNPFLQNAQNKSQVYERTENYTPPKLKINGDKQNQLSDFISILMNKQVSKRPRSAAKALKWFNDIKALIQKN